MKRIIDVLTEAKNGTVNECGGSYFIGSGGCGGGYWGDYTEWSAWKESGSREQYNNVPEKIRNEYRELLRKWSRVYSKPEEETYAAKQMADELRDIRNRNLGISGVVKEMDDAVKRKASFGRTFTITKDALKLIAYLITEEYSESGIVDNQMISALEEIKRTL
jgi:hypothetical protein